MNHLLCALLFVLGLMPYAFASPVIIPVSPQVLLAALPEAPEKWKLVSSAAGSEVMGGGEPVTVATRRYEITIEDRSVEPPVSKVVSLKLVAMDVGSRSETVSDFKEQILLAEKPDADRRKMDLGHGIAGTFRVNEDGRIKFNGICGDRLALQIEASGCEVKEFASLLKAADFSNLAYLARKLPSEKSSTGRFTMQMVDELNPKRNRSYEAGTVNFEAVLTPQAAPAPAGP